MYKITFYLLNIFGHNLSIYNIFKENTDLRLLIIVKIIKSSSLEAVISKLSAPSGTSVSVPSNTDPEASPAPAFARQSSDL